MNISIIGTGYLGLTTASVLANSGHKVYAVDINPDIVETIKKGQAHFFEVGLDELVKNAVDKNNLIPTLDYSIAIPNSDVSFICVNTPGMDSGELNTSYVKSAIESIARNMNNGHIIVMKSTVPVGTHVEIKKLIKSITAKKFSYVSKPEFLAENSAVFDTLLPDRIIIGSDDDEAFKTVYKIFESVDKYAQTVDKQKLTQYSKLYRERFNSDKPYEKRVIRVKTASAEIIKVAANSFLATKISYANALSRITDRIGADINEVFEGIGADPRIGRDFFYAGLGWGGGCFPKDLRGLVNDAKKNDFDFDLLKDVEKINNEQIDFVINKIQDIFGNALKSKTVTILGLAFKPGTDDIRISPAIKLVENLAPLVSKINAIDPKANKNASNYLEKFENIEYFEEIKEATKKTNLIVLATDWPEFIDLDFQAVGENLKDKILIDARNRWNKDRVKEAGFKYFGIGR